MTAFLIARLPSLPISLEAIEFMQKNNFSIRISTNVSLMDFLMSSGGGESRQLEVLEEIEPGKEEVHVIANLTCIFPFEIKAEVDSTENSPINENSTLIERIVKEEDDNSMDDQPQDHNPRLEIVPEAVLPADPPMELPMVAPEYAPIDTEETEEEPIDDHQEEPEEEMNSFLNLVENDGEMNENVLLSDDHEFNESNTVISVDIPLSVVEQRVQPVQDESALEEVLQPEEEHEEQNVFDEMEGAENDQRMEDGDIHSMSVDELLEPLDADDSMLSLQPLHNDEFEEDLLEHEAMDYVKGNDVDMEEEEEELVEEQEYEDMNRDDESEEEAEEDSDEEDDNDEDASSDDDFDEADEEEKVQKKKRSDRVIGKSIDLLLFTCPVKSCTSSYSAFDELKEHMEHHRGKQDFFCDVCKKEFSSKNSVITHIQERKKKACCGCGMKFSAAAFLARHLRCHTGEKPYVCKICGKGFSQSSTLKRHTLTHTEDKPFSCGYCKKRFAQKTNLETHERTHTGKKPYVCGHCEKPFSQQGDLKKHELTHTGEKPFECKDCGNKFNQKSNLNTHIRIHTGQKPYSCKKCDAKFAQSSSLKWHMEKKHK